MTRNIRTRAVWVRSGECGWPCCFCGKNKAKRKGASPAPIGLWLRFSFLGNTPIPDPPRTMGGSVCLSCAKRISSRLDAVIDQIESEYAPRTPLKERQRTA